MSHDEIVFGEVKVREPERRTRPDRDRRFACIAYEVPGPIDLPIFLDRLAADAIERHALRDTSVELGGILLGKECLDDETGTPFVWVTKSLEAKHYENTQASFTYTHDSWEEITRERDCLHPDLDIVGWYHTHPDFGVFLSSHDLFIHRNFFAQPLQVAYVVDPIRQTRGFFQWRDGRVDQLGGFFLSADRGERIPLSRLVNDLENIPNTDGGGGGLSPRLEAELIAMLTRPAQHYVPSSTDRVQTAALFGMLGVVLGVLGLGAMLWLNTLNTQVREQAETLKDLQASVAQNSTANRLALDALLADTEDGPKAFLARHQAVLRERDEAKAKLADQKYVNELLTTSDKELRDKNVELSASVKKLRDKTDAYEKVAKDPKAYSEKVDHLTDENETQAAKIKALEKALDTAEGRRALELLNKYERTWWVAIGGWGLSVLLALGLVAALVTPKELAGMAPAPPEEPPGHEPHRIS
ncbi:MAG: Mov34/MPN/PAD-1 family protein [Isosphaeraceae bacterium]|nr:Mov34/MPN/PAD-1 family protein [Isosphaeraceae bacterium]